MPNLLEKRLRLLRLETLRLIDALNAGVSEAGQVLAGGIPEELECSDVNTDRNVKLILAETLATKQLSLVDQALARLKLGKYGKCQNCKSGISVMRLEALPFALRCKSCEEKIEAASVGANRASFPSMVSLQLDRNESRVRTK